MILNILLKKASQLDCFLGYDILLILIYSGTFKEKMRLLGIGLLMNVASISFVEFIIFYRILNKIV